jgi:ribosome biogenesis protein UTP30
MLLAVRAVVAHFNQKLASGSDLLGSDESMLVMLSLHRIPDALSPFPFAVPLAHPLLDAPKICLFGAGDGADLKAAVAKAGLKDLKVIGINKLRRKYKPYEMRRKLAGSHDLFLCDSQIQPQLLSVLGKSFFHKSKFPLGVDVSGDVAKQIAEARTSTLLRQSAGTTWVVKIGGTGWDARKLAENAITAANNAVAKCVTGKWENIRAIHVKSDTSIALPVFEQLAPVGFQLEGATAPV